MRRASAGFASKSGLACWLVAGCLATPVDAHWNASRPADRNQPAETYEQVKTVHVVFTDHLDVGWTDFAIDVINDYFHVFFPRAYETFGDLGSDPTVFKYSTHPWIVSLFLDCPQEIVPTLRCPSVDQKERFKEYVGKGAIVWQGNPFDLYIELLDPSLYEYGLTIAEEINEDFDNPPNVTLAHIDAPSATRGMVPLARRQGVEAIYFGWNGGVVAPEVPSTPAAFVWQNGEDENTSVIGMLYKGSYGSSFGGHTLPACIVVPDVEHALCLSFTFAPDGTQENGGPPDAKTVLQIHESLRLQFPQGIPIASTFDAFTRQIVKAKDKLPVFDQEIGDTWIYGVPGDPLKFARYREMTRARAECIASKVCDPKDPAIRNFSRFLLKIPEHNQGLNTSNYLGSFGQQWANDWFYLVRPVWNFRTVEASWDEQRRFLDWAMAALDRSSSPSARNLRRRIDEGLAALEPKRPATAAMTPVVASQRFECGDFTIGFDPASGAISYLKDKLSGYEWAVPPAAGGSVCEHEVRAFGPYADAKVKGRGATARPDVRRSPVAGGTRYPTPPDVSSVQLPAEVWVTPANPHNWPSPRRDIMQLPADPTLKQRGSLAAAGNPLALFLYQTYSVEDYNQFALGYSYIQPPAWWFSGAFGKQGLEAAYPTHRFWCPKLERLWMSDDEESCRFALELAMVDEPVVSAQYGAPREIWLEIGIPKADRKIFLDLQWFDKPTTRLPEALWLAFAPALPATDPEAQGWRLDKLGEWISPYGVVVNGNRHLHGVWEGTAYCDGEGRNLRLRTLDAPIVSLAALDTTHCVHGSETGETCPATVNILNFNNHQPEVEAGMFFTLEGNLWGNNFPQWYPWKPEDAAMRYRFVMEFEESCPYR